MLRKLATGALVVLISTTNLLAQGSNKAITYEELYDDPYAIKKLFVHFQPLYAEMFTANVTIGFGGTVNYLHEDKFNVFAHARQAYARSFDLARDAAFKNPYGLNNPEVYNYFEGGGTYHIKDTETDTETKIVLYSSRYEKNPGRWAAKVPEYTVIPVKVRKIIGGRAGAFYYDTSTDLNRVLDDQEVELTDQNAELLNPAVRDNFYLNGNFAVTAAFVGASMSWFKNVAIKPDRGFGVLTDNHLFTAFGDLLVAPSIVLEDLERREVDPDDVNSTRLRVFSLQDVVETSMIGFRLGIEGKYNRELGWAYGIETGIRPGIKGRGFYLLGKISLPVYGTSLDYAREAFGK